MVGTTTIKAQAGQTPLGLDPMSEGTQDSSCHLNHLGPTCLIQAQDTYALVDCGLCPVFSLHAMHYKTSLYTTGSLPTTEPCGSAAPGIPQTLPANANNEEDPHVLMRSHL